MNINRAAHTAITIYMHAWKVPLLFILSLSFDENTLIQLDKLNPESGITAPAPKEPNDARNINHFLFLYNSIILCLSGIIQEEERILLVF